MTTTRRTATMSRPNAWGRVRTVTVAWMPEDISWIDPAGQNVGAQIFAFADEPPVYLARDPFGGVNLVTAKRSLAGELSTVAEFRRVESEVELTPGTFTILADAEE